VLLYILTGGALNICPSGFSQKKEGMPMSVTDFLTVVSALLAFFTAGYSFGHSVGYRLGQKDQREEDRQKK
jgi:hypothetical protein